MKRPQLITGKVAAATLIFAATSLSACGVTGDLKRGEPIFSEPAKDTKPAELPADNRSSLPKLPERPASETPPNADDELLGGPGG
jgi:hypothetical protein